MVSAGEPLDPETIAAFRAATGPRARRRLRPDRDRPGHRQPRRRAGPPGLDGQAAAGDRDPHRGADARPASANCSCAPPPPPPSSRRYLDGERFEGEWWPTGDLVRADDDGYLFFEGRDDDIILSSGYRIGPFEVESALQSHPAVAEAAAVAAPDPERGAVVRAIVVPRDREPSEELARELQEHCKRVDRPLQVPPHRRVRRRAAEDEQRQDQARAAAPGVTWPGGHQQRGRPTRRPSPALTSRRSAAATSTR